MGGGDNYFWLGASAEEADPATRASHEAAISVASPPSGECPLRGSVDEWLLRKAREHGDIIAGDDGFYIYWPSADRGAHNEWSLRAIADELERINEPWRLQIERDLGAIA